MTFIPTHVPRGHSEFVKSQPQDHLGQVRHVVVLGEGGEGHQGPHRAPVNLGEAEVLPLVEPPPDPLPALQSQDESRVVDRSEDNVTPVGVAAEYVSFQRGKYRALGLRRDETEIITGTLILMADGFWYVVW